MFFTFQNRKNIKIWRCRLSVKALAGPCRTEPTIVTEVGLRRMTVFGTGFYNLIKSEVNIDETFKSMRILHTPIRYELRAGSQIKTLVGILKKMRTITKSLHTVSRSRIVRSIP